MKINIGKDLYLKGRIGWKGLAKHEYLNLSDYRIINGLSLKVGFIDWNLAGYINKDRYEESPEIMLEINDILISKDGTLGKVGIVRDLDKPSTVASGIFVLRNNKKDKLDTEYLFQYLKSNQFTKFINTIKAEGSTINHLYQRDLSRLEFDIPALDTQKRISKFLFSLDQKIELNNKINAELEAIAKLLYDYWFVQFDFPDENGKPYKSSGGKMVWSNVLKMDIPIGWNVGGFEDIGDIVGGSTPSKGNYNYFTEDGIPWITPKDLSLNSNKKFIARGELDLTELGAKKASLKMLPKGTVLLSSRAPIGYIAISRNVVTTNQGFKSIIPKKSYSTEYVYHVVKLYVNAMIQYSSGSTFDEISASTLKMIKIPIPKIEFIDSFTEKVKPLFAKQDILEQENEQLITLRGWLLPMLMNGQVKITS